MASKSLRRVLMKMFSINENDSSGAAVVSNFTISADNANRAHIEQAIEKMGPGNTVEFVGEDRVKYTGPNPEKAEKELGTLGLQKISESEEDEDEKLSFDPESGKNLDDIEEDDDESGDDSNLTDEEKAEKQRLADEAQKKIEEDNSSDEEEEDEEDEDEDMSIIAESLKPAARRVRGQITSPRAKDKIK